ncbi:hypothetical protein DOTSEDRAFT_71742 [Dothistroma septosporum NZE10]|uniref:Uncharacterized protein n=1 Tax=Dothistroma septosporum (strain NZE10 / CBS 128990) TaxID=675120 RepID=N1PLZ7_DOTSN|nr:hypothetical protein DOTSEDRAFT_71742 [Dothistroma septosporum NZE10]
MYLLSLLLLPLLGACIALPHIDDTPKEQLQRRHQTISTTKASSPQPSPPISEPGRALAHSQGTDNYNQFIADSKAAAASGHSSSAATQALFSSYIPKAGNPYALYYKNNGNGNAAKAALNHYGLKSAPATGAAPLASPKGAPSNDQTSAMIRIMGQKGLAKG